MGFAFNQGGTPLTRLSTLDNPNPMGSMANKSFTVVGRFSFAAFAAAQYLFAVQETSNFVQNYAVEVTNSTTIKVRIPRDAGDSTHTLTVPAMTASTSTFYDMVFLVEVDSTANERVVTAYFRATAAGSAGFFQGGEEPFTDDDAGAGSELPAVGLFHWGNDGSDADGFDRKFTGNATDLALFEGVLSAQDIENFGKGWSPLQFASATLRSCPMNVNAAALDVLPGATVALAVGGTAQFTSEATLWDGPKTDTTAELGYVSTSHIASWSAGSVSRPSIGYDTATATGNLRVALDEAGAGRYGYHATANLRPRFKVATNGDRRIGIGTNASAGTAPAKLNANNNPGNISNRNTSIGFVYSRLATNALMDSDTSCVIGSIGGIIIGTDADGYITIRTASTNKTPLLPSGKGVRFQGQPMPFILTISNEAGTDTRTFNLYSNEGTATVTSPSYAANDATSISFVGGSATNRGGYGVLKAFDLWSFEFDSSDAAQQIAAYNARFGIESVCSGMIYYTGSSTPEGSGVKLSTCANALYQLTTSTRYRRVGHGYFNTTTPQRVLTVSDTGTYAAASYSGGVFTHGETVTQAGGFSGKVLYQNNTLVYLYDCNSTAPTTGNTSPTDDLVGTVTRRVSGNTATDTTNYLFNTAAGGRAAVMKTALNEFTSEPKILWLNGASNAINSGFPVADVVECEKRLVGWAKANCPNLRVYITTNIPRIGGYGNAHQAYNAAIKAVTGYWDAVVDYESFTAFDFLDNTGTDDNGLYDYSDNTYYQEDDSGTANDTIHTNELGNSLMALLASGIFSIVLAGGGGGGGGGVGAFGCKICKWEGGGAI